MTFGAAVFGGSAFGTASSDVGGPSAGASVALLRIVVAPGEVGRRRLQLRVRIAHRGTSLVPVRIDVGHIRGLSSVPLSISVSARGMSATQLSVVVSTRYVPPLAGAPPFVWSADVHLGGQNVSACLTGRLEVDAEEGAARIARFALAPTGTDVVLADYIGADVVVTFRRYENDVLKGQWRLFTGYVDEPEHDPSTHVITFTCTDHLQSKVMGMTRAQIDKLVPGGAWSPYVFDRWAKPDQYLNDRISTTPGAVDCDEYGSAKWSAWAGEIDRTFGDAEILDGSISTRLAPVSNARFTQLDIHYKRPRVKVRGIEFRYDAPSASEQLYRGIRALTRASVEQALSGTGATIVGAVAFMEYPPATSVPGRGVVLAADPGALCMGAMATLNRRYSQWIDESWRVKVGATGTRTEEQRIVSVEWDTSGSDHSQLPANAVTAFMAAKVRGPVPYIPPRYVAGETIVEYVPDGQPDATAFVTAYRASVLAAARATADSLRGSVVGFTVILDPTIRLQSYQAVDCMHASGSGKVRRVSHKMDIEAGSAVTAVEIDCVSVTFPIVPSPYRQPIPSDIKPGSLSCIANTWIGGLADSPAWDETTMFGFSCNDTATGMPANNRYPEQFSVMCPGIEDDAMGTISVPPRCTMTAGSNVIEALTTTDGFAEEVEITGAGVPAGTKVVSFDSAARTATLTAACSATGPDREVRLKSRKYIQQVSVSYSPLIVRNGPIVRG